MAVGGDHSSMADITIRPARPADSAPSAARRPGLQRVPAGEVLVAEVAGELVAALSPAGAIANPFRPTADVVDLLRLRSAALRAPARPTRRPVRARLRPA